MDPSITEEGLNARRKAVVLKGFPLLALSFQTLGMLRSLQSSTILPSHATVQASSTPILALSALSPFERPQVTDILI
jgi:hypothetical protein